MNAIELDVQGMTCGSCVKHVSAALSQLAGVTAVAVDLGTARVRVSGSPDTAELIDALTEAGYPAQMSAAVAPSTPPADNPMKGCCCR